MLDAYTVRKAVPRILIAVIGINVSIFVCIALVDLVNVVSGGLARLISSPFTATGLTSFGLPTDPATAVTGGVGVVVGGGAMALALNTAIGSVAASGGGLGLIAGAAGSALGALFFMIIPIVILALAILCVVVLRQALLFFLIVVSPVAIALFVLPGTEKYFKKWWDLFLKTLLVYPIIALMFALSDIFASIIFGTNQNNLGLAAIITGVVVIFAPLFMIPFAFKLAGGAISAIMNVASGRAGGFNQRYAKWRENPNSVAGKYRTKAQDNRRQMGLTGGQVAAGTAGAFSRLRRGRVREIGSGYSSAAGAITTENSLRRNEELSKHESMQPVKNNDDYLLAAMSFRDPNTGRIRTRTDQEILEFLEGRGYDPASRSQALDSIKRAKAVGSQQEFDRFAAVQLAGTGTAFAGGAHEMNEAILIASGARYNQATNTWEGGDSVLEGNLMAGARSNAQQARRLDLVSGFGTNMRALGMQRNGASAASVDETVTDNVLDTQTAGAAISQRGTSVQNLVPAMNRRIDRAIQAVADAHTTGNPHNIAFAERQLKQELASTAAMHDVASSISPENARIIADRVLGRNIDLSSAPPAVRDLLAAGPGGVRTTQTDMTILDAIELKRSDVDFQQMRKEYQTSTQSAAATAAAAAAAGTPGPGAGGPPPIPGVGTP